jgi:4-diphosphocytidyl-2-C-methyl-D-erythritol kinase
MISFPNAKINLGLNITEKFPDGYHGIQSVLYPVPLCDILEINVATDGLFSFDSLGLKIECDTSDNLCVKAYNLLQERFDISPVKILLQKIIPSGAGLGGGSSDAAFTLRMLNDLFDLKLETLVLKELASSLGMDCPFFIENTPALATGRGDSLTPLDLSLSGYTICIARPDIHISTAGAYAGVTPRQGRICPSDLTALSASSWKGMLKNQFEETLFVKFPQLQLLVNEFYDAGAVYASLTGSGSAVYGIFTSAPRLHSKFENMFYREGELR